MESTCTICRENPKNATLSGCDHAFCMACIRRWSKEENSCPLCRARFNEIRCTTTKRVQSVPHRNQGKKIIVRLGSTSIRFCLPRLVNFYRVPHSELAQTEHRLNILRHFILFPRMKRILLTMFKWGRLNNDWALRVFDILERFFRLNDPVVPYGWIEHTQRTVHSIFPNHVSSLTDNAEQTKDISVYLFHLKLQGFSSAKMVEKVEEFRENIDDEEWCRDHLPYL